MSILFNSRTQAYDWLSNFSPHPVHDFPTVEHAYQAAKSTSSEEWGIIKALATPVEAKRYSKRIQFFRTDWDVIKDRVMDKALRIKFSDETLNDMLMRTHPQELVHYCPWGDRYWGVDTNMVGDNKLGKILMQIRDDLLMTHMPR